MTIKKFVFVSLSLLVLSCGPSNGGNNIWGQDPAPHIEPKDGDYYCGPACDAMKNELINDDGGIGCSPLGDPVELEDGGTISCEQWCIELIYNGIDFNPECIATKIKKCEEIESICRR